MVVESQALSHYLFLYEIQDTTGQITTVKVDNIKIKNIVINMENREIGEK